MYQRRANILLFRHQAMKGALCQLTLEAREHYFGNEGSILRRGNDGSYRLIFHIRVGSFFAWSPLLKRIDKELKVCYCFCEVSDMQKNNLCGAMIKQIHDEIEKLSNSSLRSQDLTMAQMHVLMELEAAPARQLSLKELERLLHVAQSTTAGIVSRLEQKGFVKTFGDAQDRRVKIVRITDSGLDCCANAETYIQCTEARLLSGLTESEKTLFRELLRKICGNL